MTAPVMPSTIVPTMPIASSPGTKKRANPDDGPTTMKPTIEPMSTRCPCRRPRERGCDDPEHAPSSFRWTRR